MAKKTNDAIEVTIKPAKGRPMLQWVGKRPLKRMTAFPAQQIEVFGEDPENGGRLYHGDNKEVLCHLLANGYRGKVDLIYIDPPFDSGADYVRRVLLRGGRGIQVAAEGYTLGEQVQYSDIWANDNYLQFMYERLLLLKELLTEQGAIYLHCDWNKSHYLRCLLDEVFGSDSCRNEIVWQRNYARSDSHTFNHIHDTVFFYTKSDSFWWNKQFTAYTSEYTDTFYHFVEKGTGRRFASDNLTAAGLRNGSSGRPWRGHNPAAYGNHWKFAAEKLDALDGEGRIHWPDSGGMPRYKRYLDEMKGRPLQSIWTDISFVSSWSGERSEYPTQKPEELIERLINASSRPNGLILDCFVGSGTTAAVAQKLGRRWIGCDINKGAIQTTSKRLQGIIQEQMGERVKRKKTPELIKDENAPPEPAQYGFTVCRVNDYDLQIQHNEAVNLACEHIGVTRTKADSFFDGTLGKRLVKIAPFNHPLSPLDLEEVKKELDARPDEQRDILVVSLGKELAVGTWLEEWNRLRKRGEVPNKIEVIELRTDPKYGKFFAHKPATARLDIKRDKNAITVEIKDFISPSIIERLADQSGVLSPKIADWRAMVDCVMIDPAYDGKVFNVALSDIPEKKTDFVKGTYELDTPKGKHTTIALKIIDMLGEEVLIVKEI